MKGNQGKPTVNISPLDHNPLFRGGGMLGGNRVPDPCFLLSSNWPRCSNTKVMYVSPRGNWKIAHKTYQSFPISLSNQQIIRSTCQRGCHKIKKRTSPQNSKNFSNSWCDVKRCHFNSNLNCTLIIRSYICTS